MLQRTLEKQGMKFRFNAAAQSAEVKDGRVRVTCKSGERNVRRRMRPRAGLHRPAACDRRARLARSRRRRWTSKGFVKVDDHFDTNVPGIWAIGDVIGGTDARPQSRGRRHRRRGADGRKSGSRELPRVPGVVYTHPELAQVGLTEADAKKEGHRGAASASSPCRPTAVPRRWTMPTA